MTPETAVPEHDVVLDVPFCTISSSAVTVFLAKELTVLPAASTASVPPPQPNSRSEIAVSTESCNILTIVRARVGSCLVDLNMSVFSVSIRVAIPQQDRKSLYSQKISN